MSNFHFHFAKEQTVRDIFIYFENKGARYYYKL